MATMAAEPLFVDTNVLVYAENRGALLHSVSRTALIAAWDAGQPLWISRQVLREYFAVVTRTVQRQRAIATAAEACDSIEAFEASFEIAEDGPSVTAELVRLTRHVPVTGRNIHDANIVATMNANGIHRIMTFNVADFRRYEPRITVIEPSGLRL